MVKIEGTKANTNFSGVITVQSKTTDTPVYFHSKKLSNLSTGYNTSTALCLEDLSGAIINSEGKISILYQQEYFYRMYFHSKNTSPSYTVKTGLSQDIKNITAIGFTRNTSDIKEDYNIYIAMSTDDASKNKAIPIDIYYDYTDDSFYTLTSTASSNKKPYIFTSKNLPTGTDFLLSTVEYTSQWIITGGQHNMNVYTDSRNLLIFTTHTISFVENDWQTL